MSWESISYCNVEFGVRQTLREFRNKFWINRGRNYIRKLHNIYFICKCLQTQSYSYPEKSNLPGYRVNRTVLFQVCGVDYFDVGNVLNNRPLCFVYGDDVSDVWTPDCLFYGRNLDREKNIVEEIDFGVIDYREYLDGLREQSCYSLGRGAAVLKVGNVVVIGEDLVPRYRWRLGILVELIKINDGLVRGWKVKVGKTKNVIRRPINCLYRTETRATEKLIVMWEKRKRRTLVIIIQQKVKRSKRNTAVSGELRQRLNDTDVNPWLVDGGESKIYDDVIFL